MDLSAAIVEKDAMRTDRRAAAQRLMVFTD
jgi:hypothetical protein